MVIGSSIKLPPHQFGASELNRTERRQITCKHQETPRAGDSSRRAIEGEETFHSNSLISRLAFKHPQESGADRALNIKAGQIMWASGEA